MTAPMLFPWLSPYIVTQRAFPKVFLIVPPPFHVLGKVGKFHFPKLKASDFGNINHRDFVALPLFVVAHGLQNVVGRNGNSCGKGKAESTETMRLRAPERTWGPCPWQRIPRGKVLFFASTPWARVCPKLSTRRRPFSFFRPVQLRFSLFQRLSNYHVEIFFHRKILFFSKTEKSSASQVAAIFTASARPFEI